MANIRYQKPKLTANIDTLFNLYTDFPILNAKIISYAFGVSINTALRAIRQCINDAKEQEAYYPLNTNEVATTTFFKFYGWDINHIETAYKMKNS
jgi:hypothetical protein